MCISTAHTCTHMHHSLHSDSQVKPQFWHETVRHKKKKKEYYRQHVIFLGTKTAALLSAWQALCCTFQMSQWCLRFFWKLWLWWERSCNQAKMWWPQNLFCAKASLEKLVMNIFWVYEGGYTRCVYESVGIIWVHTCCYSSQLEHLILLFWR